MFFSLNTGRTLHGHQWKKLPVNNHIIDRVYNMATKEGQQYISNNCKYKWNTGGEDDTVSSDIEAPMEIPTSDEDDGVSQRNTPMEFHEIADEVNEIIMDTESTILEEANVYDEQTSGSVTERSMSKQMSEMNRY